VASSALLLGCGGDDDTIGPSSPAASPSEYRPPSEYPTPQNDDAGTRMLPADLRRSIVAIAIE